MLHSIPTASLGPFGSAMTGAVQACVHCGFCLASCPTYATLGQEMDTPRGRIVLMKQVLEGGLSFEAAKPHIDRCLGCLACEPACPSGVRYRELINPFRTMTRARQTRSLGEKLRHLLLAQLLPYPGRFRVAARMGLLARRFSLIAPGAFQPMLALLPNRLPPRQTWPAVAPARNQRRARVGLLTGCVQQVLEPDINSATVEVLTRNGVEVVIPADQGCCGGLAWHTGDLPAAQRFARANIAAFPKDLDAIVTNAAGCGSTMLEYHFILRHTDAEEPAEAFRRRVVDVSAFLAQIGLVQPPDSGRRQRIAYHDACHLAQAQNIALEPRQLLLAIPKVELIAIADPHLCCGSAGSYNLEQPEIAAALGEKKARAVLATGAELVVSGNIGCLNQLRVHLTRLGSALPVRHTMQVLRDAYAGSQEN